MRDKHNDSSSRSSMVLKIFCSYETIKMLEYIKQNINSMYNIVDEVRLKILNIIEGKVPVDKQVEINSLLDEIMETIDKEMKDILAAAFLLVNECLSKNIRDSKQ